MYQRNLNKEGEGAVVEDKMRRESQRIGGKRGQREEKRREREAGDES